MHHWMQTNVVGFFPFPHASIAFKEFVLMTKLFYAIQLLQKVFLSSELAKMSLPEDLRVRSWNDLGLKSQIEIAHFSQLKDKILFNDDSDDFRKK